MRARIAAGLTPARHSVGGRSSRRRTTVRRSDQPTSGEIRRNCGRDVRKVGLIVADQEVQPGQLVLLSMTEAQPVEPEEVPGLSSATNPEAPEITQVVS